MKHSMKFWRHKVVENNGKELVFEKEKVKKTKRPEWVRRAPKPMSNGQFFTSEK